MTNIAIASLFEKLIDENTEEPFEQKPKRFYTFNEFQESILKDLTCLLNAKVSISWKSNPITTPYSYGVNVTAPTSAENVFEIQDLQFRIDDVIRRFESRLINAKSTVIGVGSDPSGVFVNIDATIALENRKTPLSFPVVIDA
jgi:predicted component of type VI protein secretion system